MRWNPIHRATLRARLLGVLLPGLSLVLALGLWTTYTDAVQAANAAFDRSLLGAVKSMDLNVSTQSGGLSVEQPYRLFEFFELTADGQVHFRVATDDGLVEIGSPDLPPPPGALVDGQAQFYDAVYLDQPVRIGALRRPLDPPVGDARRVLIQVAETTDTRRRFTTTFVQRALVRDAGFLAVLVLAVALASAWALGPVHRLAQATRERAVDDLQALPTASLPADLLPLVDAINQQMARTAALLAQRRQFLDDASHQLRTPLTTLRAQLDYALREADPARAREAIHALSLELGHAIRATNQLLALARADAGALQREPVDLQALAREVALALLPQAREKGVDFGVDVGPEVHAADAAGGPGPRPDAPALVAEGDRLLLREALANLAHNALMHGQGPITLEATAHAGGWCLGVVDAGPGLPEAVLARLGERFAKGPGSRGAGLGLSMAAAVAERHGGRLHVGPGEQGRGLRIALCWGAR